MLKHLKIKLILFLILFVSIISTTLITSINVTAATVTASEPQALLLDITGPIGPATQDYIERGLLTAEINHDRLVILRLDTPGGLDSSMRGITKAILASKLPVVAYVAPAGARAASAGTFILYASHIAAMAPGTNIGAASPVQIGAGMPAPDEFAQKTSKQAGAHSSSNSSTLEKKVTHDASAYIRGLADLHDRNSIWAEQAVRESVSLTAEEAYKMKVIDIIATDIPDLLSKINGRNVKVLENTQTLDTSHLLVKNQIPDWRYRILSIITDPSIAYILLLIGIYGLFFEFANPGFVLPGVFGSIALLLALYAFQLLPINYAGFALLLLGLSFMIAEVFISSFGVLGLGGLIAFVVGSIFLLDNQSPNYQIAWEIITLMTVVSALFFLCLINMAVQSQRKKVVTGKTALIGTKGLVIAVSTEELVVRVLGEIWKAKTESSLINNEIKVGDSVRVDKIEGLLLTVSPLPK